RRHVDRRHRAGVALAVVGAQGVPAVRPGAGRLPLHPQHGPGAVLDADPPVPVLRHGRALDPEGLRQRDDLVLGDLPARAVDRRRTGTFGERAVGPVGGPVGVGLARRDTGHAALGVAVQGERRGSGVAVGTRSRTGSGAAREAGGEIRPAAPDQQHGGGHGGDQYGRPRPRPGHAPRTVGAVGVIGVTGVVGAVGGAGVVGAVLRGGGVVGGRGPGGPAGTVLAVLGRVRRLTSGFSGGPVLTSRILGRRTVV